LPPPRSRSTPGGASTTPAVRTRPWAAQRPLDRYRPSPRNWSDAVAPFDYLPDDLVRRVQPNGRLKLHGKHRRVGRAFDGKHVALRPTGTDGLYAIFFRRQRVDQLDLRKASE